MTGGSPGPRATPALNSHHARRRLHQWHGVASVASSMLAGWPTEKREVEESWTTTNGGVIN